MVGVIIGRMENEVEKSGEKMVFVVIWLRVENGRDLGGAHEISLLPCQNTIFPNWRENRRERCPKIFGQKCLHFIFKFFG